MSIEENKAIVQSAVDAFNRGDRDAVDRLFAADYLDHDPSRTGLPPGPEGVKQAWGMFRAAFPDGRVFIEDMIAEGDRVVVRGVVRGTHQGELMGAPPTGRQVTVTLIDINRIEGGKLTERWAEQDNLGLMQQLGEIPAQAVADDAVSASQRYQARRHHAGGDHLMPVEENKALYRRWFEEVVTGRNLALADELLASDYVLHFPGMPEPVDGEGHKQLLGMFHQGFPDWRETIDDVVAEGDRVVIRVTGSGTHRGEFQGIPPTGRQVAATGVGIGRIENGRIAETWAAYDALGMMQQLGVIPGPGQTGT